MKEKIISIEEACEYLDLSRQGMYALFKEGLPHYKLSGKIKIVKQDIDEFLKLRKRVTGYDLKHKYNVRKKKA
jgi:excisionase family DNA binding protein